MAMGGLLVFILVIPAFLLVFGGLIALQVWLCRRPNRYLGLILPAISLLLSLVVLFGLVPFGMLTSVSSSPGVNSTYVVNQPGLVANIALTATVLFVLMNIPTAVYLIIYFVSRKPMKKQKELTRMQIDDL